MFLNYYRKRECNVDVTWEKIFQSAILYTDIRNPCGIELRKKYLRKGSWNNYNWDQLCWPLHLFSKSIRWMQDILKKITVPTWSISHYVATSSFVDLLSYHGPKNRTTWSRTEKVAAYFSITSVNYFNAQIERDRGCQILKDTCISISFDDKEDRDIQFKKI